MFDAPIRWFNPMFILVYIIGAGMLIASAYCFWVDRRKKTKKKA